MAVLYTYDPTGRPDAANLGSDFTNAAGVNSLRNRLIGGKIASEVGGGTSADFINLGMFPEDVRLEFPVDGLPANSTERLEAFFRAINPAGAEIGGYRPRIEKAGAGANDFDFKIQHRNPTGGAITVLKTVAGTLAVGDRAALGTLGPVVYIEKQIGGSGAWTTLVSYNTLTDNAGGPDALRFTTEGSVAFVLNGAGWRIGALQVSATGPAKTGYVLSHPSVGAGAAPATATPAWTAGAYVPLMPWGWLFPVAIDEIELRPPAAPALTTTYEALLEIAKGPAGSEVVIAQIPFTYRNVSAAGYLQAANPITLPLFEPIEIAAETRLSVRVRDSHSAALTYTGVKVKFRELAATGTSHITTTWASSYITRSRVQTTWGSSYVARQRATTTWGSSYVARQRATTTWQSSYTARARVATSWASSYVAHARPTTSWASSYSVRARVTTTWGSSYVARARASATWGSSYTTRARVTATWASSYGTHGRVVATWGSSYLTRARQTTTWGSSYQVQVTGLSHETISWPSSWTTKARVSVTWGSRYLVLAHATTSWASSYTTRARVRTDWASRYDVAHRAGAEWRSSWTTRARVSVTWGSRYLVLAHAARSWGSSYTTRARVTTAWASRYDVAHHAVAAWASSYTVAEHIRTGWLSSYTVAAGGIVFPRATAPVPSRAAGSVPPRSTVVTPPRRG